MAEPYEELRANDVILTQKIATIVSFIRRYEGDAEFRKEHSESQLEEWRQQLREAWAEKDTVKGQLKEKTPGVVADLYCLLDEKSETARKLNQLQDMLAELKHPLALLSEATSSETSSRARLSSWSRPPTRRSPTPCSASRST